jgi:GxxExxY protein
MAEFLASRINDLSYTIIACGIEVHRHIGPGMLERTYQRCLEHELHLAGLTVERRVSVPIDYKGIPAGSYELDVLVEDLIVVEVKSVAQLAPVHDAQLLAYLTATGKPLGLLMNFNVRVLKAGIRRRLNKNHTLVETLSGDIMRPGPSD